MRALNILVAEDDDQNQAIMKLILNRQGHNVMCVWNGLEAIEAVKNVLFDLIFMDVHMPVMDGIEAIKKIRIWENNQKHTPIVILTGSVPQTVTDEYKKAGADTFLLKPFDIKRILKLIDIFINESDSRISVQADNCPEISSIQQPVLDIQDALPRFDLRKDYYINNLEDFILSLPQRLDKLDQSLEAMNWKDLNINAHNLKGVAANYGAKHLSSLSAMLEDQSQQAENKQCVETVNKIHQSAKVLGELANKAIAQFRSEIFNPSGGQ